MEVFLAMKNGDPFDRRRIKEATKVSVEEKMKSRQEYEKKYFEKADKRYNFLIKNKKKILLSIIALYLIMITVSFILNASVLLTTMIVALVLNFAGFEVDCGNGLPSKRPRKPHWNGMVFCGTIIILIPAILGFFMWILFFL